MADDIQTTRNSRNVPFSEPFKAFICEGWADYDSSHICELPAASWTPARRDAVRAAFPGTTVVIPAGPLKPRNNDCDYAFRPHSAFAHLTGLGEDREPDAVLVIADAGDALFFKPRAPRTDQEFYANARYGEMWVGQRESLDEMTTLVAMPVRHINELKTTLAAAAKLAVIREADAAITGLVDALRGTSAPATVDTATATDTELATFVSQLRLVKDAFEIDQMQQACDQTAIAFGHVAADLPNAVKNGRGERWVEGVFGLHARHLGHSVGYHTISAGGDHANTLHWIRNDGDLRPGDLLLLDAGIEIGTLYTADITRTLPVSGKFTDGQRSIYDAVLEAQQAGIDAAKPGAIFKDVHDAAIAVIARYLEEWGILPVTAAESLDPETGGQHRRWMVHGTSHHLGLDVHDCAQARNDQYRFGELKPGMVITVEPGLYFKDTDLLVPAEFRGIGIRIEDDIVITEDGCRILSDKLPRTATGIETWMAEL